MTWDFKKNLAESIDASAKRMAENCLRQFFARAPDFAVDFKPGETPYQQDLDVIAFGDRYKIEQKHRVRKDYDDELIEDISNDRTGRQGWAWRISSVDYLLYTYPTSGRWTIWPGPATETAWRNNRALWIVRYKLIVAENSTYNTISYGIPTGVLRSAVAAAGARLCLHGCGRNVGRFGATCAQCRGRSCCVVSDGEWVCDSCARR